MRAEALASGGVEAAHMTIGKKLYLGFGAVLAIMLVLFIINIFTVRREYIARSTVASTLSDVKAIETVRFQMMETRLYLGNYLLSGDVRDEDKTNKGANELSEILKDAESKVNDANLKTAFVQVDEGERSWLEDFAKPMIAKRHQVDAGDATVSDLQIYYLQHDPASWLSKSAAMLEQADNTAQKLLEDSNNSATAATTWSTWITTVGTLFAVFIGCFIAFQTAKTIKEPIYHLIEVARRIGETGDLEQTIDTRRDDEVGVLAQNFNKMIVHLKEMAAASAATAEGQLSGTAPPRSQ